MIVRGELSGGERINESALAERLSVSRGPIREACRSLEQAGLVRNVANRGAFVRELSLEEASELYEVRAALAGYACRLVAERASDPVIADLVRQVDAMDESVDLDDAETYYEQNLEFHLSIIRAAANTMLVDNYLSTVKKLYIARRRSLVDRRRLADSNAEHRQIAEAAARRDPDACAAALYFHISEGWKSFAASF